MSSFCCFSDLKSAKVSIMTPKIRFNTIMMRTKKNNRSYRTRPINRIPSYKKYYILSETIACQRDHRTIGLVGCGFKSWPDQIKNLLFWQVLDNRHIGIAWRGKWRNRFSNPTISSHLHSLLIRLYSVVNAQKLGRHEQIPLIHKVQKTMWIETTLGRTRRTENKIVVD